MSTKQENDLIKAIHEKQLFDEIMPAIRAAVKAGGGAEHILKKSESIAATNLVKSALSEDAGVALKASIEILNRTQGKPVERSVNIYGDISKMSEGDVDNQIIMLLEKAGAKQLVANTLDVKPVKKARKPRKSQLFGEGNPQENS